MNWLVCCKWTIDDRSDTSSQILSWSICNKVSLSESQQDKCYRSEGKRILAVPEPRNSRKSHLPRKLTKEIHRERRGGWLPLLTGEAAKNRAGGRLAIGFLGRQPFPEWPGLLGFCGLILGFFSFLGRILVTCILSSWK